MSEYMGTRDEQLPARFTSAEREAYQWLWDRGVQPWLVDLLSKHVITPNGEYKSLVAYRKAIEEKAREGK